MYKKQTNSGSVGAMLGASLSKTSDFLTILFCALRACDVITWNWFWVMSPIFISFGLSIILLIIGGIIPIVLKDN